VVAGIVILSLGLAWLLTLTADLAVGSAPRSGSAPRRVLAETSSELGGALGIALLGTVGTVVYRSHIVDAIPAAVPNDGAAIARDTLGGAVDGAARLPHALGADLMEGAGETSRKHYRSRRHRAASSSSRPR
jgi:DHA2 family multidrug resistance protein-like MFS transporter